MVCFQKFVCRILHRIVETLSRIVSALWFVPSPRDLFDEFCIEYDLLKTDDTDSCGLLSKVCLTNFA